MYAQRLKFINSFLYSLQHKALDCHILYPTLITQLHLEFEHAKSFQELIILLSVVFASKYVQECHKMFLIADREIQG